MVASMPTIVVEQIEKAPPQFPPDRVESKTPPPKDGIINHPPSWSGDILYIYNDTQLVGQSNNFNLNYKQEFQELHSSHWEKRWTGKYTKKGKKKKKWMSIPNPWPEYFPGLKSWDIDCLNILWFTNPEELFEDHIKLKCLMQQKGIKISGDVIITQMELATAYDSSIGYSAKFFGNGTLIIN